MKSIKLIFDNQMQIIAQGAKKAALLISGQLEASTPLLISYLHYLRELNGVQNRFDFINKIAQMLKEFTELCEHNLLFFLTVTGQFNIIRTLFKENPQSRQTSVLMDEIEKERNKWLLNQNILVLFPKQIQTAILPEPYLNWAAIEVGLISMKNYEYYEKELRQLTYSYHIKQSNVYWSSANKQSDDLDRLSELVKTNSNLDKNIKRDFLKALDDLRSQISDKRKAFYDIKNRVDATGSLSEQDAKLMHDAAKDYFNTVLAAEKILEQYKDIIPAVETFYTTFKEETAKTKQEAEQNEKEFIQKKNECTRKLEEHRQIAIEYADKYIIKMIGDLNKLDLSKLNRDEKLKFDLTMEEIKVIHEKLKTSKNYVEIQELLKLVCKELNVIKEVVSSITPQKTKKILDQDLLVLQKMSIASNNANIFRDKPIVAENDVFLASQKDNERREKLNGIKLALSLDRHKMQMDPQHPIEIMRKSADALEITLSSESEDFSKLKRLKHLLDDVQLYIDQQDESKIMEIYTLANDLDKYVDDSKLTFASEEFIELCDFLKKPKNK